MPAPKPYKDVRPWGEELWITRATPTMVKVLTVNPGEMLSLQYHHHRDEFWHVLSGDGIAVIGKEEKPLASETDLYVPRMTHHRLIGGNTPLVILEVTFGEFDEKDIVRLDDKYGRT